MIGVSLVLTGSLLVYKTFSFFRDLKASETKGHFLYTEYANHHEGALQVVRNCFDKIFDPKIDSGFDGFYLLQKETLFSDPDLKVDRGSCFGNCCALGKEIIRRGRILTAAELQEIEKGDKFPKRAMGFQLAQHIVHKKMYDKCSRKEGLTSEEIRALGEPILSRYPNLIYPKNTDFKSKETVYTGFYDPDVFLCNCPEVKEPNFSGFFIISGAGQKSHALLLEIDNQTDTYVLYDNNYGFYTGKSLKDCLKKLEKKCSETYSFRNAEIHPYVLRPFPD